MVNVEAVQQVLAQIEEHPDLHDQGTFEMDWVKMTREDHPYDEDYAEDLAEYRRENGLDENWCGTTRCIAGWALYFKYGEGWHKEVEPPFIVSSAAQALGITVSQAHSIFFEYDDTRAIERLRGLLP